MATQKLADGTIHKLPADFRRAIQLDAAAKKPWSATTPLARNEWICCRQFNVPDAAHFYRIYQDPDTMRFMGSGPRSVADEMKHIERHIAEVYPQGIGLLAVTLKESRTLVGYCGLLYQTLRGNQELEITYLIDRAYWGRGFATEATQPVVDFWQPSRSEPRLVALVHPDNTASARVVVKNDFVKTGTTPFKTFGVVDLYVRARA